MSLLISGNAHNEPMMSAFHPVFARHSSAFVTVASRGCVGFNSDGSSEARR